MASQPDTDSSIHTPIPWAIQEASKGPDRDYGIKANGGIIAEVFERGGPDYEICVDAEANADFIVRAVNNFDKLLAALEKITKREGEYSRDPLQFACNTIDGMEDIARSAIDAAKA